MQTSRWVLGILLLNLALSDQTGAAVDADLLDAAARRYRIQVYESFHGNRPELDRRLAAAKEVMEGWRNRGGPGQEIADLVTWLQRATWASRSASNGPLPQYVAPLDATADRGPEAALAPSVGVAAPGTALSRSTPTPPTPSAAVTRSQPTPIETPPTWSQIIAPPLTGQLRATSNLHDAQRERPDDLPPIAVDDLIPQKPLLDRLAHADRLPAIRLRTVPNGEPSLDRPAISPAPATRVETHAGPTQLPAEMRRTDVDLVVLAAKIRSINLSLKAVEGELIENHEWSVDALENELHDLSRLIDVAAWVRLYYDAIPYEQREQVEPLVDWGPIQALLAQRAFETRIRLTDEARADAAGIVEVQLDRLESISEVMQRWKKDQ